MKKLLLFLALAVCAFAQSANDFIMTQRNSGNTANLQRNIGVGTSGQVLTSQGAGLPWVMQTLPGTGTVTSVSFTGGLISVATPTSTPALTVAGTSGGIPFFSSASTWGSSAALTANALMIGGGAGAAPSTITTGTGVLTALGNNTNSAGGFSPIDGTATLTNKTINGANNTLTVRLANDISGFGTGVATALAVNTGTAGSVQLNNASGAGLTSLTAANIAAGAFANGMTATTQSASDNSTKLATTAYADAAVAAGVTASSTTTFTNKRITPRVVTASDATSITPNTDNADITYQSNSQSAGTLTVNADGGTPTNGQRWILKIKSTNAQTYSWNAVFVSGSDVTLPTSHTGSSKIDNIGFMYDSVNSKWECVAVARGY